MRWWGTPSRPSYAALAHVVGTVTAKSGLFTLLISGSFSVVRRLSVSTGQSSPRWAEIE